MRILLTNDDGYHAPGLKVLEEIAATLSDDLWIVAPAAEQSGTGRALTLTRPIRVHRHAERRFAVDGTPTDAVMMALAELMRDGPPDLILSGVNRGANLGEDVLYSGTVSAAAEGALAGIRSIALSQRYPHGNRAAHSFAAAQGWGERVLRPLLDAPFAPRTLVNINFPPVDPQAVAGIRVVPQGLRDYGRVRMDGRVDARGYPYYWLAMDGVRGGQDRDSALPDSALPDSTVPDTDLAAECDDRITVTPLHLDLTHQPSMAMLRQIYG